MAGYWAFLEHTEGRDKCVPIPVRSWKKTLTGNGNASKALVRRRVHGFWEQSLVDEAAPQEENECDAVGVALHAAFELISLYKTAQKQGIVHEKIFNVCVAKPLTLKNGDEIIQYFTVGKAFSSEKNGKTIVSVKLGVHLVEKELVLFESEAKEPKDLGDAGNGIPF